jgi:NADPH:quinone reductase-like Zn-dependent oxidoreductase
MKAFRVHSYGDPSGSHLGETDLPEIMPEEILIRVASAAVNPMDWHVQSGALKAYLPYRLPVTLGWDVAGVAHKIGGAVSGIEVGDRLFAMADITRDGCFAEYAAVRAELVARAPTSISLIEAASVPLAALTSWWSLFDTAKLQKGQSVLVHGAAGGVGSFAVQLAKNAGALVTATCSTSAVPLVKSLGVDDVIDYSHDDFSRRSGFDVVFDTVGGDVRARSWQVLKPGGILITITLPEPNAIPRTDVRGVLVRNRPDGARLAKVAKLIDAGAVRPLIAGTFDLGNVDKAIAKNREGHVHGKLIVRIGGE